ncbi:hypothetical protein TIFTF001_036670 [Ficus carica]|uniref:Uncharacterized protein n=1 Tax=Ficus carica TaxID=3494 RepID=A0AA88J801_FICCA|nr:hypothetical protein TIFTF001_036664 [Ficus carica]GMN67608.1 hypothetical protein TIFTF001_036670 [Ficus carica]
MQEERQSFGKAKMIIPEIEGSSSIYRRSSRVRVLGETRSKVGGDPCSRWVQGQGWRQLRGEVESRFRRPMPVWNLLLGFRCSEHCFVRVYGPFRRERGTWSTNDSVLGERPAIR